MNIIERPKTTGRRMSKRDLVWYWRECSAYDLAARKNAQVSEEEYEKAFKLLDSIQRYALKDARQWERANTYERYANSSQCKKDEAMLELKRNNLVAELNEYNCTLLNYGLYPSVVDIETKRDLYALHYFD